MKKNVMSESLIQVSPTNIALIKYMGKQGEGNNPINPSFSYTLEHLVSGVKLTPTSKDQDYWLPLDNQGWLHLSMTEEEQNRFLLFFKKLKNIFQLKQNYLIQSANNFPKNAGAASSASSFSALTKAAYHQALLEGTYKPLKEEELALISRQGSGSSCRSFFKPWCLWDGNKIQSVPLPIKKLDHDLILLSKEEKQVSSSKAHEKVRTSPHFQGRKMRAQNRLKKLLNCLKNQQWEKIYQIVKEEFEDMHQLFETSRPCFSYRNTKTKEVLEILDQFWKEYKDGPLVTMDAGAHIHLLYRLDQTQIRKQINNHILLKKGLKTWSFHL